jgi:hypothetical protein
LEDVCVSVVAPSPLLSDSTSAINIECDSVKHELTKHIGVDASIVLATGAGFLALQYVPSE